MHCNPQFVGLPDKLRGSRVHLSGLGLAAARSVIPSHTLGAHTYSSGFWRFEHDRHLGPPERLLWALAPSTTLSVALRHHLTDVESAETGRPYFPRRRYRAALHHAQPSRLFIFCSGESFSAEPLAS